MKTIDRPAAFLLENGILFEINRQILHPLGLQLDFEIGEDGFLSRADLRDNRDSPNPISFTPQEFDEGRRKYEAYMAEFGKRNLQKRRQMGVLKQTGPNMPPHVHPGDFD